MAVLLVSRVVLLIARGALAGLLLSKAAAQAEPRERRMGVGSCSFDVMLWKRHEPSIWQTT